jgi:hypothetical protein
LKNFEDFSPTSGGFGLGTRLIHPLEAVARSSEAMALR